MSLICSIVLPSSTSFRAFCEVHRPVENSSRARARKERILSVFLFSSQAFNTVAMTEDAQTDYDDLNETRMLLRECAFRIGIWEPECVFHSVVLLMG